MNALYSICRFSILVLVLNINTSHAQVKLLDPASQTKFVNILPLPGIAQPDTPGGTNYEISMTQFKQDLGLKHPITGQPLLTTVWGYNGSFPGPTIEARTNKAITIKWINNLRDSNNNPLQHPLPVDTTLHWAKPEGWPLSGVPVVVHVHGGHNESASDGLPESWFTPGFEVTGPTFVKQIYKYDNDNEASTVWYHDHALGITRLNVYMGLAGFYIIRDSAEENLDLPSGAYEIPLAIQDRVFTEDGSLFYPTKQDSAGNYTDLMEPEMFGDIIMVNGKTWPVLEVEPRKYRFRIVNGSDSRFYNLTLPDNIKFHHIGSDGGLLNAPVVLDNILIGPGERKDVIVDFSDPLLLTKTLILKNDAPTPFPDGDSVIAGLTDQIMAFKVTKALQGLDNSKIPQSLRTTAIQPLTNPKITRQLILAEDEDDHGGLISMLGTAELGQLEYYDPITENPKLNDIEMWEIINTTPDAHPIHLHLVTYQVVSKQKFDTEEYEIGKPSTLKLIGNTLEPAPEDKGWKDTYVMYPGEVTRIIAKFDREGLYVWHCHILTHEDHEMMRPFYVGDMPVSVPANAERSIQAFNVDVYPNPFSGDINISLKLEKSDVVDISIYNMLGEKIASVQDGYLQPGSHNLLWNGETASGKTVPSGVYVCRIKNGEIERSFKLVKTK